jgi:hypothetical protein
VTREEEFEPPVATLVIGSIFAFTLGGSAEANRDTIPVTSR